MSIRWSALLAFSSLFVLAFPSAAFAQTANGPLYQTANGQLSFPALASQLSAAGFPGPWDPDSVTAAYARTSGGAVTLLGGGTLPPVVVVEIGGIGTDATPGAPWSAIEPYLGGAIGVRRFQYATCGDISSNTQLLLNYVQTLRPSHVVLVGHSLGGVLALNAIGNSDLSGSSQVEGVVVVDSPVNGLDPQLVEFGASIGVVPSPCQALSQLEDPAWTASSAAAEQRAASQNIKLLDVANAYDNLVPLAAQELPGQVNVRFDVTSGSGLVNHTAVFDSVAALSAIAQFIRAL